MATTTEATAGPVAATVAVQGAASPVGRRLVRRLAEDPATLPRAVEPGDGDLAGALAGVSALVLLGSAGALDDREGERRDLDGTGGADLDGAGVRALLEAATSAGVETVVVLSSAMVYGAWADNPVPLTEAAVVRPSPGLAEAAARAELERCSLAWRDASPGATVAVLRAVVVVDPERRRWFARSPWSGRRPWVARSDAARQLLAVDDLVAALDLAWRDRLDGAFNVAPDGWVAADELRELVGPFVPLPERVERWWRRGRRRGGPAGLDPYLQLPWVVANDRLRSAGWAPTSGTEATLVEAQHQRWWRRIGPAQRQRISLAAAAVALGSLAGGIATAVVRIRRRSR